VFIADDHETVALKTLDLHPVAEAAGTIASVAILSDDPFEAVRGALPKATSKKIVRAALLTLTDPHVTDRNVLHTMYALAIAHRKDEVGAGSDRHDYEDPTKKEESPRFDIVGSRRGLKGVCGF
jgi:hypothetical protein